jgi:hypothetical protein
MEGRMSWTQFVDPDDLVRMKEYHKTRRIDPSGAPHKYEFRFIRKNGEIREMINCVGMVPESKKSIASMMDITDLKQATKTLKEKSTSPRNHYRNVTGWYCHFGIGWNCSVFDSKNRCPVGV